MHSITVHFLFFLINFYFNIILRLTLWLTFPLSLSHYHPNTEKDNIFQTTLPNIQTSKNLLINFQVQKRIITTFSIPHFLTSTYYQTGPLRSITVLNMLENYSLMCNLKGHKRKRTPHMVSIKITDKCKCKRKRRTDRGEDDG